MAVKVDNLADAIVKELSEYSEDVFDDICVSVKDTAEICRKKIQENSPVLTGSYQKGWRATKAYQSGSDIRYEVHNKTDYQLAHLLEYGHANRNGGRTEGHPHIGPAADMAASLLMKKAEVAVKK